MYICDCFDGKRFAISYFYKREDLQNQNIQFSNKVKVGGLRVSPSATFVVVPFPGTVISLDLSYKNNWINNIPCPSINNYLPRCINCLKPIETSEVSRILHNITYASNVIRNFYKNHFPCVDDNSGWNGFFNSYKLLFSKCTTEGGCAITLSNIQAPLVIRYEDLKDFNLNHMSTKLENEDTRTLVELSKLLNDY